MAGLAPTTLRLPEDELPEVTANVPVEVAENSLRIEHSDGSITISLDGKPVTEEDKKPSGWFDNLVEEIDPSELSRIGEDLIRGVNDDLSSRMEWVEERSRGMRLLGLSLEVPSEQGGESAPVAGMSVVRHPILQEAVLRFQANARSEMLPTDGPVKIRDDGNNPNLAQDQLATAFERDMNHYLTSTASEYYPDTDRMFLQLGFGGTAFKKVYFCPLRNRPVSETVDADDLIVNNSATDLLNARRVTHRTYMKPSTVKRLQILGVYRDIELNTPSPANLDSFQQEKKAQQGITADEANPEDRDREIYEVYCELNIKEFEHKIDGKESGLEIPYRVTIDLSSREVLSIVRNYDKDAQDLPEAGETFIKFTFVPGFGFYDIGLVHILGNTANALTAMWREMIDAGMFANFPGFLYDEGMGRQTTSIFRVPPGGGAPVKTNGKNLRESILPLPYKEPGPAMLGLVESMASTAARVGGTSELQVGEGRSDAPVGTTLALIDQATKVMNSVHKRMHTAQAQEFRLLVDCFRDHPESFWQRNKKPTVPWDQATFQKALDTFDLVPQADPNTASHTQRVMKVVALKQLQAANMDLYDPVAVDTAALQAMGWNNPEQFMKPAAQRNQPPPEVLKGIEEIKIDHQEADAKTLTAQAAMIKAKAGGGLDPEANLRESQMKMAELQLKEKELNQRAQMHQIDDENRDKDLAVEYKMGRDRMEMERMKLAHSAQMQSADQHHEHIQNVLSLAAKIQQDKAKAK